MIGIHVDIAQLRRLLDDKKRIKREFNPAVRAALRAAAKPVLAAVRGGAPVRSGVLSKAIKIYSLRVKGGMGVQIAINPKALYPPGAAGNTKSGRARIVTARMVGRFQEAGTKFLPAQGFFAAAEHLAGPAAYDQITRALDRLLAERLG